MRHVSSPMQIAFIGEIAVAQIKAGKCDFETENIRLV
jgi:hypothetical protein